MLHPSFQKPRAEVAIEVRFNIESIQQRPGLLPMPTSMLPGFAATACGCTVGHKEGAKLRHGGPSGTAGHEKGTRPVQRARQSPAEHKHCTVKEDVALFLPWRVFPGWETTNARLGGHHIHALCSQDKKNTNDLLNYCGKSITQKKIQHRFMLNTQQARNRRELPYPGRNPHLAPYLRQKNVKLSPHQEQDNDVCSAS